MSNAQINEQVYAPIRDLKQKFYECQSNDEWQELKKQLKTVLALAKENMDEKFYDQYSQGVINSITKIYGYKQKQFNKAEKKQFTPKSSYIFREAEGEAFIKLANALTEFLTIKSKSYEK
jgi:adenosylmethionine-8-amino-7-oxononanoate aminotransferase